MRGLLDELLVFGRELDEEEVGCLVDYDNGSPQPFADLPSDCFNRLNTDLSARWDFEGIQAGAFDVASIATWTGLLSRVVGGAVTPGLTVASLVRDFPGLGSALQFGNETADDNIDGELDLLETDSDPTCQDEVLSDEWAGPDGSFTEISICAWFMLDETDIVDSEVYLWQSGHVDDPGGNNNTWTLSSTFDLASGGPETDVLQVLLDDEDAGGSPSRGGILSSAPADLQDGQWHHTCTTLKMDPEAERG